MRIIGLTGMYCAGKNYVAAILESMGFPVLDVDKQGHQVIETCREAILSRFGPEILGDDGKIDRRLLGKRVFGVPEDLSDLEGIIHPAVNRLTLEWIDAQKGEACVINAALLHRSSAFPVLDGVIIVRAQTLIRLLRAKKRDKLSWGELLRRFKSQREFISQYLRLKTDIYSVYNHGFTPICSRYWRGNLEKQLREIVSKLN